MIIRFTHVEKPNEFWGLSGTSVELNEFDEFEKRLSKWASFEYKIDGPLVTHPYQKILVSTCEKINGEVKWKRACITDISPDNTLNAFLMDYGTIVKFSCSQIITEIPAFYDEMSFLCKKCYLNGIKPIDLSNIWSKEACDYFKRLTHAKYQMELIKFEKCDKKFMPYHEFDHVYAIDASFEEHVDGKILKFTLTNELISNNFAQMTNAAALDDNSLDANYSNTSILRNKSALVILNENSNKNRPRSGHLLNKLNKNVKENRNSFLTPFDFSQEDTNDIPELRPFKVPVLNPDLNDETLMSGFKPNIKFNPDVDTLRQVLYGNRRSQVEIKLNRINTQVDQVIEKIKRVLAVNFVDDTNFIAQEVMVIYESAVQEHCVKDVSMAIVKLLLEHIASSNECANVSLEVLTFLNEHSKFCTNEMIKMCLNELKCELTQQFQFEIHEASLEKFIRILTELYKRACDSQFKQLDWLCDAKEYCVSQLLDWIEVYPHIETSEMSLKVKFMSVREFLKRAIETLKINDHAVTEQILKKASVYSQSINNSIYSNRVQKIAFEIVHIYALSYLNAPTMQQDKKHMSISETNRFIPIKRNGKRKHSNTHDIIALD